MNASLYKLASLFIKAWANLLIIIFISGVGAFFINIREQPAIIIQALSIFSLLASLKYYFLIVCLGAFFYIKKFETTTQLPSKKKVNVKKQLGFIIILSVLLLVFETIQKKRWRKANDRSRKEAQIRNNEFEKKEQKRMEKKRNDIAEMEAHPNYSIAKERIEIMRKSSKRSRVDQCVLDPSPSITTNHETKIILDEVESRYFLDFCAEKIYGNWIKVFIPQLKLDFVKNYCCFNEGKSYDQIKTIVFTGRTRISDYYKQYAASETSGKTFNRGSSYSDQLIEKSKTRLQNYKSYFAQERKVTVCNQESIPFVGFENGMRVKIVEWNKDHSDLNVKRCGSTLLGKTVKIELPNNSSDYVEDYCCQSEKRKIPVRARVFIDGEEVSNTL